MFDKCADCAKKHLRAALAYVLESKRDGDAPWSATASVAGYASQAVVLLGEAGACPALYARHFDLGVGCLVKAEDLAVQIGFPKLADEIRVFRLGVAFEGDVVKMPMPPSCVDMALGHWCEAAREGEVEVNGVMTNNIFLKRFNELMEAQDGKEEG
jgi:hypothetical protein